MLKLTNKARALVELNSHASLLVPLALPQRPLPHSVRLDASSPWNVTALLGAALESTTLYTRLKTTDRVNSSSLGNIADLLNVFGNQVIANLEMSVVPGSPEPAPEDRQNGTNGTANGTGALSSISDAGLDAYNVYGAHHGNDDDDYGDETGNLDGFPWEDSSRYPFPCQTCPHLFDWYSSSSLSFLFLASSVPTSFLPPSYLD